MGSSREHPGSPRTRSMHAGRVAARVSGLGEDLQRLDEGELLARDADAPIAEEEIVLGELRANLSDEEDRVARLGVPELHERALRPLAALERERLAEHVKALGRELG